MSVENKLARFILADNPWDHADRRVSRKDNPGKKTKFGIGAKRRYSAGTMTTEDLCAMGPLVEAVAAPDAYLGLWVTMPLFQDGLDVMKAWGFKYATTLFVWHKVYPKSGDTFCGPGRYSFSNVEVVILGTRGKKKRTWHSNTGFTPRQVLSLPHPRASVVNETSGKSSMKIIHSRKPKEFQDTIVKWLGSQMEGLSFIELFATEKKDNWVTMGHAVSGLDIREELKLYSDNLIKVN